MKLQDFLIGIGVFSLFAISIFGFIDNSGTDCKGIYCEGYLNITHDAKTNKAISNISTVSQTAGGDFQGIRDDMKGFADDPDAPDEPTDGNMLQRAIKVLMSLPNSWKPVANVMQMIQVQFGIPDAFANWVIASVIIIIILILLAAFLKNKLQS